MRDQTIMLLYAYDTFKIMRDYARSMTERISQSGKAGAVVI